MRLAVVSYKRSWADATSATGWATVGGFPLQMAALAHLFDETVLVLPRATAPAPPGTVPLTGPGLSVRTLPEPVGRGLGRKLSLTLAWLPRHLPALWRAIGRADAVHALVPGDLGTVGLVLALLRGKPLLVRHCGTWGDRSTLANRFLAWLLPRIARHPGVVLLATGGGPEPPEPGRPEITWIFSTTLSEADWLALAPAPPGPAEPSEDERRALRLVTVGRLTAGKNQAAAVEAVALLAERGVEVTLDVAGDGPRAAHLAALAERLGVAGRVRFHGNVPHARVLEILTASDLFVFPTRVAEGFPKAVLEAMAAGIPVLAPPVSVLPTLLAGGGGALLDGTDAEAVAEAIAPWAADRGRLARAGARARESSRGYTLEAWAGEIGRRLEERWGSELAPAPGGGP